MFLGVLTINDIGYNSSCPIVMTYFIQFVTIIFLSHQIVEYSDHFVCLLKVTNWYTSILQEKRKKEKRGREKKRRKKRGREEIALFTIEEIWFYSNTRLQELNYKKCHCPVLKIMLNT